MSSVRRNYRDKSIPLFQSFLFELCRATLTIQACNRGLPVVPEGLGLVWTFLVGYYISTEVQSVAHHPRCLPVMGQNCCLWCLFSPLSLWACIYSTYFHTISYANITAPQTQRWYRFHLNRLSLRREEKKQKRRRRFKRGWQKLLRERDTNRSLES